MLIFVDSFFMYFDLGFVYVIRSEKEEIHNKFDKNGEI